MKTLLFLLPIFAIIASYNCATYFSSSTPSSTAPRRLQAADFDPPRAGAECPFEDCSDVPLCYDPQLNTGQDRTTGHGRLPSDSWLGSLDVSENGEVPDNIRYSTLNSNDLGTVQHTSGSAIKSRAFMGKKPSCQAANAWADDDLEGPFHSYLLHLEATLKNKQLTCDATQWEEGVAATVNGEQVNVCRNKANHIAKDMNGQPYNDASLLVWDHENSAAWKRGWEQGYCSREAAEAGKCNAHLPGRVPDGTAPGLRPDGTLDIDFSQGLAGELGVPQIGSKGAMSHRRKKAGSWHNEIAIVKDPEHPEEGNVARLDSYVKNIGTAEEPVWVGGPLGGLVTTRMYASAKYEVRAKVPKATGYVWALWTFWGGVDVLSDVRVPEECSKFEDLAPGDKYSCATCRDTYPTSASPFFVNQETEPGIFLPQMGKQILNHEIDIEIPANAPQSTKDGIGGDINTTWKVPDKYNTLNMNNYRWTNGAGTGTYSNMFTVHDKPLQGDGKYHNYRFDWHTGGKDKTGKFQRARVDFYFDDEFIGSNDLMVPSGASRYWILLWPHGSGGPGGSGSWNGRISWWRDPATGQLHPNRDALGQPLPATPSNGLALYASTWVSRVLIEPFYEENDRVFPTAFDQPHMNRRVVCDSTNHLLACGTDQVIPLRTPNHYPLNENGLQVAPCCGATCMSQAALGSSSGTTDPAGQCPFHRNTVPDGQQERQGGCSCRKGGRDIHGDYAWAADEYDATCEWVPDKLVTLHHACDSTPVPMSFDTTKWGNSDPWDMNAGCRVSLDSACVPAGLSGSAADAACNDWVRDNCGEPRGSSYWEVYARPNGACKIAMKPGSGETSPDYTTFPGVTKSTAASHMLPEGETYEGCSINFLLHPPAHDGSGTEEEGCAWFIQDYCPGAQHQHFNIAVSSKTDGNGNRVCAIGRKLEFTPRTPEPGVYPGFRAKCDWDWSIYRPPCSNDAGCASWATHHCDEPNKLSGTCNGGACQFMVTDTALKEEHAPGPVCYTNNPSPQTTRWGCDWDYRKYPPCASASAGTSGSTCTKWVSDHCARTEGMYVGVSERPTRQGLYICEISSAWESKVGGAPGACKTDVCLSEGSGEGTSPLSPSLEPVENPEEPAMGPGTGGDTTAHDGEGSQVPEPSTEPRPDVPSEETDSGSDGGAAPPEADDDAQTSGGAVNSPDLSPTVAPESPPVTGEDSTTGSTQDGNTDGDTSGGSESSSGGDSDVSSHSETPGSSGPQQPSGSDPDTTSSSDGGEYKPQENFPPGSEQEGGSVWQFVSWALIAMGVLLAIALVVLLVVTVRRRKKAKAQRYRASHYTKPSRRGDQPVTPSADAVPNPLAGRTLELDEV